MSTTNSDYILPEGWQIDPSFAETVGPKIKKKDHLSGNQDASSMLRSEIGDDMDGADMSEEEYAFWSECGCDHEEDDGPHGVVGDGNRRTHSILVLKTSTVYGTGTV